MNAVEFDGWRLEEWPDVGDVVTVEEIAEATGVDEEQVRAAVEYYRNHGAEMQELRAENERVLEETVSSGQ